MSQPKLFNTKRQLKWLPVYYLAIVVFAMLPLFSIWLSEILDKKLGCNIYQTGTETCIRYGVNWAVLIHNLGNGWWQKFITVPIGAIIIVILTYVAIYDSFYHAKQK